MKDVQIFSSAIIFLFLVFCPIRVHAVDEPRIKSMPTNDIVKNLIESQKSKDFTAYSALFNEVYSRAESGETEAMFWKSLFLYNICSEGVRLKIEKTKSEPLCKEVLISVKRVAENDATQKKFSAAAMDLAAEMYQEGIGTEASKYLAAEWYVKAAHKKYSNFDREGALRSMEKALVLIPDHPAALKLRDAIFSEQKPR